MKTQKKLKHPNIKLFIMDVDGVLTNGKIYISDAGIETKCFHVHDGMGIKLLLNNNIDVAVISGRRSKATEKRLHELGIKYAYHGVADKLKPFNELKKKLHLKDENIAYIGDDLPDLPIMQKAGFSIAVANATAAIRKIADYTTKAKGGKGAVREACELILSFLP
jgi:3-deoxy-D-manno-octulosonate 8-phosphate phosphatase (KDO 8-P phosphatase)